MTKNTEAMTRLSLITIIFCMLGSPDASSQAWRLTTELGISGGGFPRSQARGNGTERIQPVVSPVVGIHTQRKLIAGLYLGAAMRLTRTGSEITSTNSTGTGSVEEVERTHFTKLSSGLTASYRFGLGRSGAIEVTSGFRWNYRIHGYYYYRLSSNFAGQRYETSRQFDPLSDANISSQASRNGLEASLAAAVLISKHIGIQAQYTLTSGVTFSEAQVGPFDATLIRHEYQRNDWSLSLIYSW